MILPLLTASLLACPQEPPPDLLTVAESSGYRATATSAEVQELMEAIAARSTLARMIEMGRTNEDRPIQVMVLADPPLSRADEANRRDEAIVFAFGNIHAGEVCGKEALLMLAREIALADDHPLLDDLIIVLAPNYNADGNDRMSPDNRPGQKGPEAGMGQRPNAQGLDLNRDYVKLESPEARALVRFLGAWDPHLTIDTHTTNGSRHRYTLTYDAPLHPASPPAQVAFLRNELLPTVSERLHERTGYHTFFYGNFDRARTSWSTYSADPRFGANYQGLRGQLSILSEAYSYAPYRDRVLCTLEFVREICRYAAEHRQTLRTLRDEQRLATADAGRNPQPSDVVPLRTRPRAELRPVTILGLTRSGSDGEPVPEDIPVVHRSGFEATLSVRRPAAYLLMPGLETVVKKLQEHGIAVEAFSGSAIVERYTVRGIERRSRPFQGHQIVTLAVDSTTTSVTMPPGSWIVSTAQPLGTLAAYLLEPQSSDGLVAWNYFDDHIEEGRPFPVVRLRSRADLTQSR
ncbi:MAG: M14 family metallopeptidase [Planctomycetota bacterium]